MTMLDTGNASVIAYLRTYGPDSVIAIFNGSCTPQTISINPASAEASGTKAKTLLATDARLAANTSFKEVTLAPIQAGSRA
jgi:hypothetical protein